MGKPRNRYKQFLLSVTEYADLETRKECFRLKISRQAFHRALLRDYFIRNKGIDIELRQHDEPLNQNGKNV